MSLRSLQAGDEPLRHRVVLEDGAAVQVHELGSGPPLVLIPGWACSIEVFEQNIPTFARERRVIAYDPRSQGLSDQTDTGNDYVQRGRDLQRILDSTDAQDVALLGWSLGIYDALSYIHQFGLDRVSCLVLADESPKIVKSQESDWGEGTADEIEALLSIVSGSDYLAFFRGYMAEGFQGAAPEALLDRLAENAAKLPALRAAALLEDATRHDFTGVCEQAAKRVPVLHILREEWAALRSGGLRGTSRVRAWKCSADTSCCSSIQKPSIDWCCRFWETPSARENRCRMGNAYVFFAIFLDSG